MKRSPWLIPTLISLVAVASVCLLAMRSRYSSDDLFKGPKVIVTQVNFCIAGYDNPPVKVRNPRVLKAFERAFAERLPPRFDGSGGPARSMPAKIYFDGGSVHVDLNFFATEASGGRVLSVAMLQLYVSNPIELDVPTDTWLGREAGSGPSSQPGEQPISQAEATAGLMDYLISLDWIP